LWGRKLKGEGKKEEREKRRRREWWDDWSNSEFSQTRVFDRTGVILR
jgi:hypothetical protein